MVGPGIMAAGTSVAMVCTETNGGSARIVKPRSSTPGGSGIQACSGSCRKGLSPTYGCADERVGLQNWQGEAGQTGSGIESNARGRRGFREREKCDNREDCRDKSRHGREQSYWCAYRRSQTTLDTSAAASEGSCSSVGDGSASRPDVEIACIECELRDLEAALAAVPAEICTDNTVDAVSAQLQRLLNILKEDPGVDPNLVSLATAHSAQLIAVFQHAFEEVERQRGLQADPPRRLRGKQSQKVHPLRPRMSIRTRRGRSRGLTNEKCCSGSTDSSIYTMTVATANVRTLHPKEETESRSRFGGTLMVGKVEVLEIAMRDAGIDVIGLQESRSRQAEIFNGPLYHR